MKITRKEKKNNKIKQRLDIKKGTYTPWKVRSKKYSKYPYIITVSFFRKNLFLSVSDICGRIKLWTNAGRLGFKGTDKTQYLSVVTIAEKFFKKLIRYGIRDVFLKFNNYKRSRHAIKKAIKKLKLAPKRKKYQKKQGKLVWVTINGKKKRIMKYGKPRKIRFLGIWTELHVSFNGCRKRKDRRKRSRRRAKRIRLK